jgi:spore germination cell wall hydrolase CwlJ-like protein
MLTNTIASVVIAQALASYPHSPTEPLDEVLCLAEMVYHEARGEPLEGQYAVALVAKNRVESGRFPDTYCKVLSQPYQYSYRNNGQPVTHLSNMSVPDVDALWWATRVALDVQNGYIADYTNGAKWYVNEDKLERRPKWLQRMDVVATIGEHSFMKLQGE